MASRGSDSEDPPPPCYEEAMGKTMEAGSDTAVAAAPMDIHRLVPLGRLRPLSQLNVYQTSWLFPLIMRVKDTLQLLTKQVKAMEERKGDLGPSIFHLLDKPYPVMLSMVEVVTASHDSRVRPEIISEDLYEKLLSQKNGYNSLKTDLLRDIQRNMKNIRTWIEEQLEQDVGWKEENPRIPSMSTVELRSFKSAMMKVESGWTKFSNQSDPGLIDYAADRVLKTDMEYFWSLLTRMADEDLDEDQKKDEGERYPEGLRHRRQNYLGEGKGAPSQEDEEQAEEMGPVRLPAKDGGLPKPSASTQDDSGAMAPETESARRNKSLRDRFQKLLQNTPATPAEDMEMMPTMETMSPDDVDVTVDNDNDENDDNDNESRPRYGSVDSYQEATGNDWLDVGRYSPKHSSIGDDSASARRVEQFEIDDTDAEAGTNQQRRHSGPPYDVGTLPIPFLRHLVNFVVRRWRQLKAHWPKWSNTKRLVLVFSVIFVVGLVLLVSLLPASFVYVDYYEMGFIYNRATKKTDFSRVYDFGCHLLAPQHSLVLFPSTVHFLDLKLSVMNKAGMTIGLDVYLQYLLRPSELSLMYRRYNREYESVVRRMAESTVKNMAMDFSLEEYKMERPMVEAKIFTKLRRVLSGDCCNDDHRYQRPQTNNTNNNTSAECNTNSTSCDQGYHVDLAYFQMGAINIPDKIMQHYLKTIILEEETKREIYIQKKAIVVKHTSLLVQNISNQANEIVQEARAESLRIKMTSEAARLKMVEQSYVASLKETFKLLAITDQEEKLSLIYLNTLKNAKDNLVAFSYNYDPETIVSP